MGMDQPPPPQPPEGEGGPKPPDFGEMGGKLKAAQGPDRMILIAGLLFFIDSFLPWYGVSVGPFSVNAKGWSSGGLAVLAILFALAALVVAVLAVVGMMKDVGVPLGTLQLVLCGGALVFTLLRFVTETRNTKYGLFIAIVLGAVMTFAAWQKKSAGA
jgi:hypothetical protein